MRACIIISSTPYSLRLWTSVSVIQKKEYIILSILGVITYTSVYPKFDRIYSFYINEDATRVTYDMTNPFRG